jgi:hypothetical protein
MILEKIVYDAIENLCNMFESKEKHKSIYCNGVLKCTLLKLENLLEFFENTNKLFNTHQHTYQNYDKISLFNMWTDYFRYYLASLVYTESIIYNTYYKPYNICIPANYFKMIIIATDTMILQNSYQKPQQKQIKQSELFANTNLDINDSSKMWNPFVFSVIENVFDCEESEANKVSDDMNDMNDDMNDDINEINDIVYIVDIVDIEEKANMKSNKRQSRKRGGRRVREYRERKMRESEQQKLDQNKQEYSQKKQKNKTKWYKSREE